MFLRNTWYVAAWSWEVGPAPLARKILGESLVLFRTAGGALAALEDRCIHRGMPLSRGEVDGEIIRCQYHGLEFAASGVCAKAPGQDRIPPSAFVTSYPLVEKDAVLWIWMGDRERADPALIPSHRYHSEPATFTPTRGIMVPVACNWELLNDNLLNLTHVGYLHKKTIGGNGQSHAKAEEKTTRSERGVSLDRRMPDVDPPPQYLQCYDFKGKVDRWQEVTWVPGFIQIANGGLDAGTGAYSGTRVGGAQFFGFHGITPESENATLYFFSQSRNFKLGDEAVTELLHQSTLITLGEDKDALEAQATRCLETPARGFADLKGDTAGIQARLIVRKLIDEERQAPARELAAR